MQRWEVHGWDCVSSVVWPWLTLTLLRLFPESMLSRHTLCTLAKIKGSLHCVFFLFVCFIHFSISLLTQKKNRNGDIYLTLSHRFTKSPWEGITRNLVLYYSEKKKKNKTKHMMNREAGTTQIAPHPHYTCIKSCHCDKNRLKPDW